MLCAAATIIGFATAARADDPPPVLSASARETLDLWGVAGGVHPATIVMNKIQISGTLATDQLGLAGVTIHAQIFRTDGASLSARTGDIQTADNIDAAPVTRLFESWIEKKFGDDTRSLALRAGLMDLNSDFDSIQTASLFMNSSHGIGADLSRSGTNGPSIYPVSSLGLRASWLPSKRWTLRIAAFDGVPGDPARPGAFVSVKLRRADGVLAIGQVDYHLSDKARIELGVWGYSALAPALAGSASGPAHDRGAYASIEGPIPAMKGLSAWLRIGAANGDAQAIADYVGTGVVAEGWFAGRPEDRIGLAVAHADLDRAAARALEVSKGETSIEASYQYKISESFAVQPDIQYILHPAGSPGARDALLFGLRMVMSAGYPKKAPATEATDPTVPPEGPQPDDANGATAK
jgi:porin